jgi:hypothetical protein
MNINYAVRHEISVMPSGHYARSEGNLVSTPVCLVSPEDREKLFTYQEMTWRVDAELLDRREELGIPDFIQDVWDLVEDYVWDSQKYMAARQELLAQFSVPEMVEINPSNVDGWERIHLSDIYVRN